MKTRLVVYFLFVMTLVNCVAQANLLSNPIQPTLTNLQDQHPAPQIFEPDASSLLPREGEALPLPYQRDFDDQQPLEGTMSVSWTYAADYALTANLNDNNPMRYADTPLLGPIPAQALLTFNYRYVRPLNYRDFPKKAEDIGTLQIQISEDDGENWTTVHVIHSGNHKSSVYYQPVYLPLTSFATESIMFRFKAIQGSGDYKLNINQISVYELPDEPDLHLSTSSLHWYGVQQFESETQILTIYNLGAGPRQITMADFNLNGSGFSIDPGALPLTLMAYQSLNIPVSFNPSVLGEHTGNLSITHNAGTHQIQLTGDCIPDNMIHYGIESDYLDMPTALYHISYTQSIYPKQTLDTQGQQINSIWMYWMNYQNVVCAMDVDIYMAHTDLEAFADANSWLLESELTSVLSGWVELPATSGWVEIPLHRPFVYDNSHNLVIAINQHQLSNLTGNQAMFGSLDAEYRSLNFESYHYQVDPAYPPQGVMMQGYPLIRLSFADPPTQISAPILQYPEAAAEELPIQGFELSWRPDLNNGVMPDSYVLYMSLSEANLYNDFSWPVTGLSFDPVQAIVNQIGYSYQDRWYWTVEALYAGQTGMRATPRYFDITDIKGELELDVNSLQASLTWPDNLYQTQQFNLINVGSEDLDFSIDFQDNTARNTHQYPDPADAPFRLTPIDPGSLDALLLDAVTTSRDSLIFQFYHPLAYSAGYGITSDGENIYLSQNDFIVKYDMDGSFISNISIAGASMIYDITWDGEYLYGSTATNDILIIDIRRSSVVGIITAPRNVMGLDYDPDVDGFWISALGLGDMMLINRQGEILHSLSYPYIDINGLAYDNVSGATPSLWLQASFLDAVLILQIDIDSGEMLQGYDIESFPLNAAASGLDIITDVVSGTASLVGVAPPILFYGLELCQLHPWASVDVTSGTIAPQTAIPITLSFDAQMQEVGTCFGQLNITHNGTNAAGQIDLQLNVGGNPAPEFTISVGDTILFAETEIQNPQRHRVTITNTGGSSPSPLVLSEADFALSANVEGNFSLDHTGLPVSLARNQSYHFFVNFTPQSAGNKTAYLHIYEGTGMGRTVHDILLTGSGSEEELCHVVNLQATNQDQQVELNWGILYGTPSQPGWKHYDTIDDLSGGVGMGGAIPFDVAIKFDTRTLSSYQGMNITQIRFMSRSFNTAYSVKVWTGQNDNLSPAQEVHSQLYPDLAIGGITVTLDPPIPITGQTAIWVGVHCDVFEGEVYHPIGLDSGPAVAGKSDLINYQGWHSLYQSYGINRNLSIQAYVDDAREILIMPEGRPVSQYLPADQKSAHIPGVANDGESTRELRGFNIYRDNVLLNEELIRGTSFRDQLPAYGDYDYKVQALYYTDDDLYSEALSYTAQPTSALPLPFVEDWSSGDLSENHWQSEGANWLVTNLGNPAPGIIFTDYPYIQDYSLSLTGPLLKSPIIHGVKLSFDLMLNIFDSLNLNCITPQVWDGIAWHDIDQILSADNGGLGWSYTRFTYDISQYATNPAFRIRFLASGEDSYSINYWCLDNIKVEALPNPLPCPVPEITSVGDQILLSWDPVPGADWYLIYAADDPYDAFTYLGYLPAKADNNLLRPSATKKFFQIRTMAIETPEGSQLAP
jgi:hypothetical protein